jgi:hypothetical protein
LLSYEVLFFPLSVLVICFHAFFHPNSISYSLKSSMRTPSRFLTFDKDSAILDFSDQVSDTREDWNRGRTWGPSFFTNILWEINVHG